MSRSKFINATYMHMYTQRLKVTFNLLAARLHYIFQQLLAHTAIFYSHLSIVRTTHKLRATRAKFSHPRSCTHLFLEQLSSEATYVCGLYQNSNYKIKKKEKRYVQTVNTR